MILYIVIGLVLASFVFTFLGARTWHWGYVILVEALFLATLGCFMLAAEAVRINAVLRTQVRTLEKQHDELAVDVEGLERGTTDSKILARLAATDPPTAMEEGAESIPSIEDLNHKLLIATRLRGRVWRNVMPAGVDPKTGVVRVTFSAPPRPAPAANPDAPEGTPAPAPAPAPAAPGGIKADSVVYLFEEGDPQPPGANGAPRGPQYLGEFNVTQAAGPQATLQPAQALDPTDFEFKRLQASRGPWVMYETMPMDRHDIYAGLKDEQLQQLLPKQTVQEYLRHGKEATNDDDPARKIGLDANGDQVPADQIDTAVKKVYQRRLRDYATEFDELSRRRISLLAASDAVKKDIEQLTAAEDVAKKLQAFRTAERQKLTTDLAGVTKEREAIEKHLAGVQQLLAKAKQLTADLMASNRALVAQLAARQLGTSPANQPNGNGAAPAKSPEPVALAK